MCIISHFGVSEKPSAEKNSGANVSAMTSLFRIASQASQTDAAMSTVMTIAVVDPRDTGIEAKGTFESATTSAFISRTGFNASSIRTSANGTPAAPASAQMRLRAQQRGKIAAQTTFARGDTSGSWQNIELA